MRKISFLFILLTFTLLSCSFEGIKKPPSASFNLSKLGKIKRNVTYCIMDGVEIKMDVYYPATADERWVALVYIHGGSWTGGDKFSPVTMRDRAALVASGFLVVSVNYRLAPEHPFPAMIQDVKCAVRYLRAHADEYNLDADRIGAWGNSAGGHLAALLGLTDKSVGWDVESYLEYSSAVQAVVDFYGPTNMETYFPNNDEQIFKNKDLSAASPIRYVTENAPPFLILHGDIDGQVLLAQSEDLAAQLNASGVNAELVIVQNGGHGFTADDSPNMQPTREEVTRLVVEFFTKILR